MPGAVSDFKSSVGLFESQKLTILSVAASSNKLRSCRNRPTDNTDLRHMLLGLYLQQNDSMLRSKRICPLLLGAVKDCNFVKVLAAETNTHHRTLLLIFSAKSSEDSTLCLQHTRFHMMRHSYSIRHAAGEDLIAVDFLSTNPLSETHGQGLEDEVAVYIHGMTTAFPTMDKQLDTNQKPQKQTQLTGY